MDTITSTKPLTLTSGELHARLGEVLRLFGEGKLTELAVTHDGQVVAVMTSPLAEALDRFDAFKRAVEGTVVLADDYDPSGPTLDGEWHGERDAVHR